MNKPVSGFVQEVFYSLQGEGPWLGKPQWFIRFAGCRQNCAFCDTPRAQAYYPRKWLFWNPVVAKPLRFSNPITSSEIVQMIKTSLGKSTAPVSVAITGGEPMEQGDFLFALAGELRKSINKVEILLETNGLEYEIADKLKNRFDFISMDIKLKSSAKISGSVQAHALFLKNMRGAKGCVKMVVSPKTIPQEIGQAVQLVAKHKLGWEIILQPLAGCNWKTPKNQAQLAKLWKAAQKYYPTVRIIPQMHVWFGMK